LESLNQLPPDKQKLWENYHFTQWKLYKEIGYFIGCGEWHTFDYVPYCNQRMYRHSHFNTWDRQNIRVLGNREAGQEIGSDLKDEKSIEKFLTERETEQMFHTMQALSGESDSYHFLSGNMPNNGLIPNIPEHCIVELPATVTRKGIEMHPTPGSLPLFFENWLQIQTTIAELSVRAVLDHSRQAAIEAIVCDPSFRDCDCSPGQLLDEMLEANKGLVPLLK
jgi:alpha-galactosidase